MCTKVCTTDKDRPGKMAVTKSVPVMMSQTISTAADLGLLQVFFLFFIKVIIEKNVSSVYKYMIHVITRRL